MEPSIYTDLVLLTGIWLSILKALQYAVRIIAKATAE